MKRHLTAAVSVMMMGVACGEGLEQPSSPESSGAPELAQQESGLSTTVTYAIQTCGGNMLTARNGGGVTTAALETDRSWISSWEKFTLKDMGGGWYVLKTANNYSVTVVNAGGQSAASGDVIHTDIPHESLWEKLYLVPLGGNLYALKTTNGYYLSAEGCGGIGGSSAFASDKTVIGSWEKFRFIEVHN